MSQRRARRRIRYSIEVARFAGSHKCRHVSSYALSPETLRDSTKSRLVPVIRRLVQQAKHFLLEQRGHHDSCRDGSFITMFHQFVFQLELWSHVSEQFLLRIQLDVARFESCSTSQQIGDERNCIVCTLLSEPVGPSFPTIDLRGEAGKGRETFREISGHLDFDSNLIETRESIDDTVFGSADVLDNNRVPLHIGEPARNAGRGFRLFREQPGNRAMIST